MESTGSVEEAGTSETSHGKKPSTRYTGGLYRGNLNWPLEKSLMSKGYCGMMRLKKTMV